VAARDRGGQLERQVTPQRPARGPARRERRYRLAGQPQQLFDVGAQPLVPRAGLAEEAGTLLGSEVEGAIEERVGGRPPMPRVDGRDPFSS
jgi:hypothetical protein